MQFLDTIMIEFQYYFKTPNLLIFFLILTFLKRNENIKYTMFINKFTTALEAFLVCIGSTAYAQSFKVALDVGTSGKDYGTAYKNYVEKEIVLDVALKVGELLKADKDIKVIYTRKTDVFVEVAERTRIANREKADVFISIHANAAKNREASGTETFIMGMSKN